MITEIISKNEAVYSKEGLGVKTLETLEETVNYNTYLVSKMIPFLNKKNLELGAGRGTLSAIISKNYPIELYEIAEDNNSYLKERFCGNPNIESIGSDFLTKTNFESYDCIYSSNVLEHIEEDEKFLLHGLKLLRKGGYFVAIVPAMIALYSEFDKKIGHLRRYNRQDKNRLFLFLQNNNIQFRFLNYKYFNPIGCLGWYFKMKLLKSTQINLSDSMTMDKLIPFIQYLDFFPFPFGQSILMVVQKL